MHILRTTIIVVFLSTLGLAQENEVTVFQVTLSGGQLFPPVATPHGGEGLVYLDLDTGRLRYEIVLSGSSSTFVAADLRVGEPGEPGATMFPLVGGPVVLAGTSPPLSAAQRDALQDYRVFVRVVTSAHPNGEMRGQVTAARSQMAAYLRGDKVVPPTGSLATGSVEFVVDPDTNVVAGKGDVSGLSGPITSVVVRDGIPGAAGPVMFSLPVVSATAFQGVSTPISELSLARLRSRRAFVEIQTAAFPSGEVAGPIIATFLEFGDGCPSSIGPVRLTAEGLATPGGLMLGTVGTAPPNTFGLVTKSLVGGEVDVGYGCPLYSLPPLPPVFGLPLGPTGQVTLPKLLPPGLVTPCRVHVQFFGIDAASPSGGGFFATNGLTIDINR